MSDTTSAPLFKVVAVDNLDRETVAERAVAENLTLEEAERACAERIEAGYRPTLLDGDGERVYHDDRWYRMYPQERPLWRGMEEFT